MGKAAVSDPARALTTDRAELEAVVRRLADRKDAWVRTGLPERIAYLQSGIEGAWQVAPAWVDASCRHAGVDPSSALAGEAWLAGPMVTIDGLRQTMRALKDGGQPRPASLGQAANGQTVAQVMPRGLDERVLFHNMTAEVWIEPGQPASQGRIYRQKAAGEYPPGRVALVLGAGNVSSIGPLDLIHKLFVEDQVVVLKMHPVNEYLGPLFERAFAALIRDGFLAIAYGGKEVGDYLCRHDAVDSIHLTGSDRTHDAIVWGADPVEQAKRKASGRPLSDKEFTSELGCVTPIMVVPGNWSASDLDFQARHVAGMVAHNASFDCTAGQVLLLARDWPARDQFLERTRQALANVPPRRAYYPGAQERYATFCERYPAALALGRAGPDVVPWTLIPDVPARHGEYALSHEAFCGLIAEVSLDCGSAPEFLEQAVEFCNESIWGTLSCALLVDRATRRAHRQAVEQAIADLHYGSIGLNVWPGVNFGLSCTSWGAFPGHPPQEIVSGSGFVHNTLLFDHPQKSVVRSHFRIRPKPIWFADHRTLDVLGRHLTAFAANRSLWSLIRVALAGMRG